MLVGEVAAEVSRTWDARRRRVVSSGLARKGGCPFSGCKGGESLRVGDEDDGRSCAALPARCEVGRVAAGS
jgi:hypothetical protein